jgi:outer membrane protein assembly factor BamB
MLEKFKTALIIALIVSSNSGYSDDWPAWRGPQRNGISKETSWSPTSLNSGAKISWRKNVGKGHSSFAIKGDNLYTMGNIDDQDIVYCLETKDGSEVWQYKYACEAGNFNGPRSAPVLDGDYVYTMSRDGQVFCLAATTGKLKWKHNVAVSEGMKIPRWGVASSPCIEDNLVLLNVGTSGVALDKQTGKKVWSGGTDNSSYATPVVFNSGSKKLVAMFNGKAVSVVSLETGKKIWSFPWETKYDVNAADPIISDDKMYISSGYGTGGGLLDIKGSKPKIIWKNKTIKSHFNSCVLIDGYLYGIDDNTGKGAVVCMEFKTGTEKWRHGKGCEGLISANGKLIIMDKKGTLSIAEVTPISYKEISSATVLTAKAAKNWTVPVLANGYIYCRNSNGDIACVDVRK